MALTTCDLTWLSYLLRDLALPRSHPIPLFCDNQAALHIAANLVFHERTKHIELDCHTVREKLQEGLIKPTKISSHKQVADQTFPFLNYFSYSPRIFFLVTKYILYSS